MPAKNFAVCLHPDAPMQDFAPYMQTSGAGQRYILCSAVESHDTGLVRLVKTEAASNIYPLAIYVPAHYILWMLQADEPKQLGFLAKT